MLIDQAKREPVQNDSIRESWQFAMNDKFSKQTMARLGCFSAVLCAHLVLAFQLQTVNAAARPHLAANTAAKPGASISLFVDGCKTPYQQNYQRGQAAAGLDISNNRLKVSIALGLAPVPPSPSDVERAQYEAKLFGQRGIVAEVASTSCVPPPCDEAAYAEGYRNRMEHALTNKFGPDFRERIQAQVNRRFGEG